MADDDDDIKFEHVIHVTPEILKAFHQPGLSHGVLHHRKEHQDKHLGSILKLKPTIVARNTKPAKSKIEVKGVEQQLLRVGLTDKEEMLVGIGLRFQQTYDKRDGPDITAAKELVKYVQDKIDALPPPSLRDNSQKELFEEYKQERETCQTELDITIKAMWNLPGLLMDEGAEVQWQQSLATYCEAVPYLAPGGRKVTSGNPWGKSEFPEDVKYVIRRFMVDKCGFPENSAERTRLFLSSGLKHHHKVGLKHHCERIKSLNKLLPYHPCLKDSADGSTVSLRTNKQLDETALSQAIVLSLPFDLRDLLMAAQSKKSRLSFPTDLDTLVADLESVETSHGKQQNFESRLKQLEGSTKKKSHGGSNASGRNSSGNVTSSKSKGSETQRAAGKHAQRGNRFCDRCAVLEPKLKRSHNTDRCLKYPTVEAFQKALEESRFGDGGHSKGVPRKVVKQLRAQAYEHGRAKEAKKKSKRKSSKKSKHSKKSHKRKKRDPPRHEYSSDDSSSSSSSYSSSSSMSWDRR